MLTVAWIGFSVSSLKAHPQSSRKSPAFSILDLFQEGTYRFLTTAEGFSWEVRVSTYI